MPQMSNQYISNENRQRIIDAYLNKHTASQIADIMGFKRTSVYAIIKKYQNNEAIERGLKGGMRRRSLSDEQKLLIISWIDEECGLTLAQIKARCLSELNITVSKSTI
ncbi:hypothetical protein ENBRE01_3208, partial [Enteropsectra breve]